MKLLKIEKHLGYYLAEDNLYHPIDQITKESLLWILERVLEGSGELDEYREDDLRNQAHQVVYKSIYNNLSSMASRRQEFLDESERLFLEDYKRYVKDVPQQAMAEGSEPTSDASTPEA